MIVPARREPIITSFALFSNSSNKRFGRPIFFKFWQFPLITISISALFTCSVEEPIISGLGFFILAAGPLEPIALPLKYALKSVFYDIFIKKVEH